MVAHLHTRCQPTPTMPPWMGRAVRSRVPLPPIILLDPVRVTDNNQWLIQWIALVPGPFYVWADGRYRLTTYQTQVYILSESDADRLIIDVFDSPDDRPDTVRSTRFEIRWGGTAATQEYRVEQYIDSSWVVQAIVEDNGGDDYSFWSDPLDDSTTHQFRVTPIGINGLDGTALTVSKKMVRQPSESNHDVAFDDGDGTLTLTQG